MADTITIGSYNSTGLDPSKIRWINNLTEVLNIDMLGLQEHFKAIKTYEAFFSKHFMKFKSYVKPAVRESYVGRPKGGLAQLCKKGKFKRERITNQHWRIQAQVIHIQTYKILWCNVYFPTDPQTQQLSDEAEIIEILTEIENIFEQSNFHDVILSGDFNYESRRNNRYVRILKQWFMKHNLKSVWEKFDVAYTYQHNNYTSFSTIDHFFVSEGLWDNCVSASAVQLPDNPSNHSPIMLKIRVPEAPVITESIPAPNVSKPNWRKAENENIEDFSQSLHTKLSNLPLPESIQCNDVSCSNESHSHDRDSHLIDILIKMIESTHEHIPMNTSNKNTKYKSERLPGWNEIIRPLRDDSLFWHAQWVSAERPTSGRFIGLFKMMRWTRLKYHRALKQGKREANKLKSAALGAAAETGNTELFKEMKKHFGDKKSSQDCPDTFEGKVTQEDIVGKFRECYSELYNSAERLEEMEGLKDHIKTLIRTNSNASLCEVNRVNPCIIRQAMEMMKLEKTDVSQQYTSDCFANAPQIFFDQMSEIFRSFIIHGTMPAQILSCAFIPLFKGGLKNPSSFHSYRAIASCSQILKLFEYTILILWGDHLGTDSLQYGFKKASSTGSCSWMIYEIANYYYQRGGMVHAVFCDMTKAFDTCLYNKLFIKILEQGIPAIIVRCLIFAYQEQQGWVRMAGQNSEEFSIKNGTRQGSILSPFFFGVYINGVIKKLRELKIGCFVAGIWMGAAAFADDLALMAPDRHSLQRMMKVCEDYGKEHNLAFSTDPDPAKSKTKCVIFRGKKKIQYPAPIILDGKPLPYVEEITHLGHVLHESLSTDYDVARAKGKYKGRATDIREQLHFAFPSQKCKAVDLYNNDHYGFYMWDLSSEAVSSYMKSFNIEARKCWNLPPQTHVNLMEQFFCYDQVSLRKQILSRYGTFVRKLLQSPSRETRFLSNLVLNDRRSMTSRNINYLNDLTKLNVIWEAKWKIRGAIPNLSSDPVEPWRASLLSTLIEAKGTRNHSYLNLTQPQLEGLVTSLCIS